MSRRKLTPSEAKERKELVEYFSQASKCLADRGLAVSKSQLKRKYDRERMRRIRKEARTVSDESLDLL